MTVSTTTSRADYTGNGVTTAFAVPFYFLDNSHLLVLRTQISTSTTTTLTLGTDYTVSGAGVGAGGTITCTTAPTADQKLSILRNVPLTQLTHYVENDPFPAASHERALDQLTMEVQQANEAIGRALTLAKNTPSSAASTELPTPAANKLIGWNQNANGLQNVDPATLATIVAFGTAQADIFSGNGTTTQFVLTANPGALNNLDVSISGVTQKPGIDYTWASGTTITFTTAPPSGTNNVLVRYLQGLPQGTSDSAASSYLPAGTGAVATTVQSAIRSLDSRVLGGSLKDYLDGVQTNPEGPIFLQKVNTNRFEVFTPFVNTGRYLRWRFDNDESQFSASPSDIGLGYTRPYLHTTVTDVYFETTSEISVDTATSSSTVTDIGSYKYVTGTGNYFEFSGIRASRLRCTVYRATNAGIFKVTINGGSTLVNLVAKDGSGNAIIDLYSTTAAGASIMLADNLPDIDLTIRLEIVGQNVSATGDRLYLSDQANPAALRKYAPFTGVGTPYETVNETLKLGDSAVDYAIAFRPNSIPGASTPFIGSVHGYENRTLLEVYLDNAPLTLSTLSDGTIVTATRSISLYQESDIFHPSQTVSRAAAASIGWTFSRDGARQGTSWQWKYEAYVANGYTQMYTAYGANSGGAGGTLLGWADRVMFRGKGSYPVVNGDSAEIGHFVTDEVLFFGTKYSATHPSRNLEAGNTACLVKLSDIDRSLNRFNNPNAAVDAVWVQDRSTFRKMYVQPYRAQGVVQSGSGFAGGMSVSFYKTPRMFEKIAKIDV